MGVTTMAGTGFGGYALAEPWRTCVTRYQITPPRWPAGLSLKLAIIADLHACEPLMGIDRIGDIVSVQPEEIEPPPETLKGAPRKFMRGVFPVQGTLYLLLDLDTLLADELCSRSASRASHSVLQ